MNLDSLSADHNKIRLLASAEMFKKPFRQTVKTQIRLLQKQSDRVHTVCPYTCISQIT